MILSLSYHGFPPLAPFFAFLSILLFFSCSSLFFHLFNPTLSSSLPLFFSLLSLSIPLLSSPTPSSPSPLLLLHRSYSYSYSYSYTTSSTTPHLTSPLLSYSSTLLFVLPSHPPSFPLSFLSTLLSLLCPTLPAPLLSSHLLLFLFFTRNALTRSVDALCKLELKASQADLPSVLSSLERNQHDINHIEVSFCDLNDNDSFFCFSFLTV